MENALERQLEKAAEEFLTDPKYNRYKRGTLHLSKIFEWYKSDFGGTDEALLEYVSSFIEPGEKTKIRFLEYDWGLNNANSCD